MRQVRIVCFILIVTIIMAIPGCQKKEILEKKQISINIKTAPIGLGVVPDMGEVEVYDLFTAAAEKFTAQYLSLIHI